MNQTPPPSSSGRPYDDGDPDPQPNRDSDAPAQAGNPYYANQQGSAAPDLDANAPQLRSNDLQKLNRKACIPHRRVQPLGQRTRLKSNPLARQPQRSEPGDQSFRLAQKLCLAQNLARSIDKTDARAFQRHVDSCIVVHGRPLMMLGAGLPDSVEHHQFEGRPPSRKAARERALKLRRSERAAGSAGPLPHLRLRLAIASAAKQSVGPQVETWIASLRSQ
jgi:hypothetical protein